MICPSCGKDTLASVIRRMDSGKRVRGLACERERECGYEEITG